MLNTWTVIRYSGRPWYDEKWKTARHVLEAVAEDASHGGSNHDSAKILMHNSQIVIPDGLSSMAYELLFYRRAEIDKLEGIINAKVDELVPYEIERKKTK